MPRRDPLGPYRAKRSPGRTPEPAGAGPGRTSPDAAGAGAFCVQLHAARRLHYDLRLEIGGALASWAVPRGPSLDPVEKRLAVHVEDHPVEYADFEGVIPPGEYGGGAMVLWDRGVWVPLADPAAGLEQGKLLFELRGHKLRGVWTLVKIARAEREWLLIRERAHLPAGATIDDGTLPAASILSGLTVEELTAGVRRGPPLAAQAAALGAPRRAVRVEAVGMMLATPRSEPFSRAGWAFELKLDGYRTLAAREPARARLVSRSGRDVSATFPELARAVQGLAAGSVILDGEVVLHDDRGLPSFQRLQARGQIRGAAEAERAARLAPATFYAFDLLALEDRDLRSLPLVERKALLERLLPPVGPVRYVEHFAGSGEELFERVQGLGLEGIVGKKESAPYRAGRSRDWIKVRAERSAPFVVVGATRGKGSRAALGAVHLAMRGGSGLVYAGRAGSGLRGADLDRLAAQLEPLRRATPPCAGPVPTGREHVWVEPSLVCQVRYLEWTDEGLLRQPVFEGLRDDLDPETVPPPADARIAAPDEPRGPDRAASPRPPAAEGPVPEVTNSDKVFWPDEGITKGELFAYYRTIAPWLLPWLRDRPLVLTRYPDGIRGESFYQKNAPAHFPAWVRTVEVGSSDGEKAIRYVVCDDLATLLYLVNLGTIPLHLWASRVAALDRPDWCVLDLDPKGAPFENVLEVARVILKVCKEIGLPVHPKTSGGTGLHLLIPLGAALDWEMTRSLGELLARVVVGALPAIATIERVVEARGGKVYVDYLQNRRGQLIAAPFSVRPVEGARVSTPLRAAEVKPGLDPARHTIRTVPRRMARMREDPLARVLTEAPDLQSALARLQERLAADAKRSARAGRLPPSRTRGAPGTRR